jgi:hypothetical protein
MVPLYFAKRPVVERDGMLIMVDDPRIELAARRTGPGKDGPLPHPRLLPADRRNRIDATPCPTSSRKC